jgi:hypothetical protein
MDMSFNPANFEFAHIPNVPSVSFLRHSPRSRIEHQKLKLIMKNGPKTIAASTNQTNYVKTKFKSFAGCFIIIIGVCASGGPWARSQTLDDQVYSNFVGVCTRSNIDLRPFPSFTKEYVVNRGRYYCQLLDARDITKLTQAIAVPGFSVEAKTRTRIETAILMAGTAGYCPANTDLMNQWLATYMR